MYILGRRIFSFTILRLKKDILYSNLYTKVYNVRILRFNLIRVVALSNLCLNNIFSFNFHYKLGFSKCCSV